MCKNRYLFLSGHLNRWYTENDDVTKRKARLFFLTGSRSFESMHVAASIYRITGENIVQVEYPLEVMSDLLLL